MVQGRVNSLKEIWAEYTVAFTAYYELTDVEFKVIPQTVSAIKVAGNLFPNFTWMFSTKHCFGKKKKEKLKR